MTGLTTRSTVTTTATRPTTGNPSSEGARRHRLSGNTEYENWSCRATCCMDSNRGNLTLVEDIEVSLQVLSTTHVSPQPQHQRTSPTRQVSSTASLALTPITSIGLPCHAQQLTVDYCCLILDTAAIFIALPTHCTVYTLVTASC